MASFVDNNYFTEDRGRRFFEIWYVGVFSDLHPLKGKPYLLPRWQEVIATGSNAIPIVSLVHGTHNENAIRIRRGDSDVFVFTPFQKVGKALGRYDGSPVGETFIKRDGNKLYQRIPFRAPLFPGYISWWGLSSQESYETEGGKKFREALLKSKEYLNEADYLKSPSSCRYGNRGFIFSFQDLIAGYKASRSNCVVQDVYLKKAGTLRYKHEICYVVMVVMAEDLKISDIESLPSMFGDPCFEDNGCIDKDGKIVSGASPSFKIKYPFDGSYSWESMTFALYFPTGSDCLILQKQVGKEVELQHDFCTSTKPSRQYEYDWVCPNKY